MATRHTHTNSSMIRSFPKSDVCLLEFSWTCKGLEHKQLWHEGSPVNSGHRPSASGSSSSRDGEISESVSLTDSAESVQTSLAKLTLYQLYQLPNKHT